MNITLCSLFVALALVTSVSAETLEDVAARIEQRLEDVFLDTNGVMRCSTGASDVTIWESKGPYENVGIVQGFLLQALCAKYAVTHDERDLRKARRTYEAIVKVYDLSQPAGEGYFCKPWGWQLRDETSSDQFVDAMLGMDAFYNFATPAERAAIADRIPKMARWWISRNYNWQYLGRPLNWQRCRFLTFSALAEKYAKTGEFAAELKRLLADPAVTNDLPYRCGVERGRYHGPNNKIFYKVSPGTAEIGFNAVSAVLDSDPENVYANTVMESCYDLARTCIQPDGSAIINFVRTADGQWREMPPEDAFMEPPNSSDPRFNSPLLRFHGPVRETAVGAVQGLAVLSEYYPPAQAWMDLHGEEILLAMAQRGFGRTDPYGIEPESVREMLARFPDHCESDCAWLHAYWLWRLHQTGRTLRDFNARRPDWMRGGQGVMVHWLFPEGKNVDQLAREFDIDRFMRDFESTGADWLIFTVGQCRDAWATPSAVTDRLAGKGYAATRDLVGEIASRVTKLGKKFIAYVAVDQSSPGAFHDRFGWDEADPARRVFVKNMTDAIREWSLRWGGNCAGWWLDGAAKKYYPNGFDFDAWFAACRAGNPNAVVTANPGQDDFSVFGSSDFAAGEALEARMEDVTKIRSHVLFPLDGYWGGYWEWPDWVRDLKLPRFETHPQVYDPDYYAKLLRSGEFPDPVYTAAEIAAFAAALKACGVGVTFNLGIDPKGRINPKSLALLPCAAKSSQPWQMFKRRLGMFIHWGIYAVDGWHEQARMRKAMSRDEYAKLAQGFTAEKFDANHFVDIAQSAGADYIVFTTKHHDGFCLWDTQTTDFNVMKTPCGRDVLKELAEVCRRRGMKLGLYYSNPDWNHPNAYNEKSSHQLAAPNPGDQPDMAKYVEYVKAQITELMTNYGEICCLFWDIPTKVSVPELNELVRRLQPNIRIDDRGWGSKGDYSTPERGVEGDEAFTRLTEACDSVGAESWGYRVNEDYHTHGYLTRAIDRTLARGGNLLLNVGPKADGTIPTESVKIMRRVGAWLAKTRESYDGVTTEPNAVEGAVVTRRGNTVYVHYPKGLTATGLNLAPLDAEPRRVSLLNDGRALPFRVEYMPSSFRSTKQPSLHVWDIPAAEFADEALVLKLEYESLGRLKGNTIMLPGPEHAKTLRRHTGIPSVAVSPKNGRLWVSFYTGTTPGEDSNNYCVLATSGDGGKTWQEVLVADPDGEGPLRAFDPQVWVAPDGKLRWTWTERLAPLAKTAKDAYAGGKADPKNDRLRSVTLSAENLPTAPLPATRTLGRGVMMEKPIVTREGTWLYPVSYWFAAPSSMVLASADGGRSYDVRGGATLPKKLRQFDEQSLVQLKDGRLAVFMRTEGTNGIWRAESADGGRTWSESRFSGICHVASRPFVRRLKSGNLLLVKHGRPDEVTKGRCRLMAFLSRDDGATWEGGLELDERAGVSYPDGDQASDGVIRLVYDHDRVTAQEILMVTFTEEDVLVGRPVSGRAMLKQVIVQGGR